MEMIDFTLMPQRKKAYSGANGNKLSILYNNEVYMVKFPSPPSINKEMSYTNSCISEYIGCHIFELIGIPVQETLLGTYKINGKEKIVVACKDFAQHGKQLQDFASLKNQAITSSRGGYGTELSDILYAIEEQKSVSPKIIVERFWDMFIVDALIGNWDRHNGNWGFLYDENTDTQVLAPVFDCGSCLCPQADEEMMIKVLTKKNELNYRVFEHPTSSITINNKRIKYFDYISSLENPNCNSALKRIVPRINLSEIYDVIDDISCINDTQKKFYKLIITERKDKILDYSLKLLLEPKQNLNIRRR